MVSLLFISEWDAKDIWRKRLTSLMPELSFNAYSDGDYDPAAIDVALVWKPPPGVMAGLPNLRLIASLGMGVDHIFADPQLPAGVPVTRIVDADLIDRMAEYVVHAVLHYHREQDRFDADQRARRWEPGYLPHAGERTVGILGLGAIGSDCARKLGVLNFRVAGWSRSPKSVDGVDCFAGNGALPDFLGRCDYLVCLLPLTDETRGILNRETLTLLPEGAVVINAARGGHVVDADLIAALDSGHLAHAHLDVFDPEPPPEDHPFWSHPKVRMTPHVAGITNPDTAAHQIVENLRRLEAGRPLINQVDPVRGY